MNPSIHLSDEVLGQLVAEQTISTDPQQAETHLSHCVACQQRLLSLAAAPEWRTEAVENLQSSSDWICGSTSNTQTNRFQADFSKGKPYGDAFDLSTVDAMMKEILGPPSHPEMLGRLGRYEIESVLGCGGMGVVLRGHDHDLQRPVAIKLILPRLAKNGTAKQRFAREARAAAAVLHPNVISIHGIDETSGVPWFVMPLVAGPSLKELVDEKGPLPEREIVQIGMQIASGLAAAHSQGLVHRDIKPENILVDNNVNRVVITDFGLARRDSEESMTQTGVVAGTLNYMSPEQAQGKSVDARCDLFSLGSLLFYLAAGEVPFQAEVPIGVVHKIVQDQHPDVRTLNPTISPTLAAVIDRLLAKDPQDRFASACELEDVFKQYVNFLNQPASAQAPDIKDIQRVPQRSKNRISERTFLRAFAVLATFAIVFLIGAYVTTRLFAPTPVPPEKLWQSIQADYQLTSPDDFASEFEELMLRYEGFSSQFASEEGLFRETDEFTNQLESLRSQIDQVGQQLD